MFLCKARVIAQKVIRFGITVPALEKPTLFLLDYAIAIFRRLCTSEPILTAYDDDLKIWLRLTKLLESNLYFLGMDGKDRGETRFFKKIVQPDDVVFDVGGNIGQMTLIAAKRASWGAVHVFEPAQDNYQRLVSNVEINQFKHVTTNKNAVSNRDMNITLYAPRTYNTGAISMYPDSTSEMDVEEVKAIRLDDYVATHQIPKVSIIKIDVEGAEMDVLEGSLNILRTHQPRVLMELTVEIQERANRTVAQIFEFWKGLNYDIYRIDDQGNLEPIEQVSQFTSDQNLYCTPVKQG